MERFRLWPVDEDCPGSHASSYSYASWCEIGEYVSSQARRTLVEPPVAIPSTDRDPNLCALWSPWLKTSRPLCLPHLGGWLGKRRPDHNMDLVPSHSAPMPLAIAFFAACISPFFLVALKQNDLLNGGVALPVGLNEADGVVEHYPGDDPPRDFPLTHRFFADVPSLKKIIMNCPRIKPK